MHEGHLLKLALLSSVTLVQMAARSITWVWGRSLPGIEDLNPARKCIVLGLQKHSSGGVEQTVVSTSELKLNDYTVTISTYIAFEIKQMQR
jgi:hypothetical protein